MALVLAWFAAYASGFWPWIGYASLTRKSLGVGAIAAAGEQRAGWEGGPDDFWFLRGQQVVIDYDAEIRAGSLYFHVFQPLDGVLGDGPSYYVTKSGKGRWTTPVEKTGYYHLTIGPSVLHATGDGWDLSYTVKWGALPPTSR